jgi:hypothetical protein
MTLKFITLPNGQRFAWTELLRIRREQQKGARQSQQPALFEMHDDSRPVCNDELTAATNNPCSSETDRQPSGFHLRTCTKWKATSGTMWRVLCRVPHQCDHAPPSAGLL